jgi:hypothetical protein
MNTRLLLWLVFGVISAWFGAWLLGLLFLSDMASRGQFGDQFGAVNALFSGLAFVVIFCALYAQNEAMKQQKKQFEEELREQKLQFERQVELAALTSYSDLTLALWQNNQQNAEREPSRRQFWADAAKTRYDEMMVARAAFEKLLKEKGLLQKSG